MKKIIDEIKVRLTAKNCWCAEVARAVVSAFLAPQNYPLEELADIRCSVSEAVCNCVIHAYKEPSDNNFIYISARIYDNHKISVEISDNGCGFDTSIFAKAEKGMGFVVMQNFMDSVSVKSKIGKGTTVLMRKKMTKESEDTE